MERLCEEPPAKPNSLILTPLNSSGGLISPSTNAVPGRYYLGYLHPNSSHQDKLKRHHNPPGRSRDGMSLQHRNMYCRMHKFHTESIKGRAVSESALGRLTIISRASSGFASSAGEEEAAATTTTEREVVNFMIGGVTEDLAERGGIVCGERCERLEVCGDIISFLRGNLTTFILFTPINSCLLNLDSFTSLRALQKVETFTKPISCGTSPSCIGRDLRKSNSYSRRVAAGMGPPYHARARAPAAAASASRDPASIGL